MPIQDNPGGTMEGGLWDNAGSFVDLVSISAPISVICASKSVEKPLLMIL